MTKLLISEIKDVMSGETVAVICGSWKTAEVTSLSPKFYRSLSKSSSLISDKT